MSGSHRDDRAFEHLASRQRKAEGALWLVIFFLALLTVLSAAGILAMANLMPQLWPGDWDGYDLINGSLSALYILALLTSGILFLRWHRQAVRTGEQLGAAILTHAAPSRRVGWATVAWFVPIANLFVPYQSLKELAKIGSPLEGSDGGGEGESEDDDDPNGDRAESEKAVLGLLAVWWGFWIVNMLYGRANLAIWKLMGESTREWITSSAMDVFGSGFQILTGFLAIMVLRVVTRRHRELWSTVRPGDPAPADSSEGIAAGPAMPYNLPPGPT